MKLIIVLLAISLLVTGVFAQQTTIIDDWVTVKAPAAPTLQPVKVDSKTAVLILDVEARTVDPRPRAKPLLPKLAKLIAFARANNMVVAYANTGAGSRETILPEVKPLADELVVKASVDKFFGTDLEKHLKDKGITQVIVTGFTTEGAVLGSSIGAVLRGFKVIVPLDGTASVEPYAEQYVAWHLMNAPAVRGNVTLTKIDLITK